MSGDSRLRTTSFADGQGGEEAPPEMDNLTGISVTQTPEGKKVRYLLLAVLVLLSPGMSITIILPSASFSLAYLYIFSLALLSFLCDLRRWQSPGGCSRAFFAACRRACLVSPFPVPSAFLHLSRPYSLPLRPEHAVSRLPLDVSSLARAFAFKILVGC